jgi:hypothetical protein
MKVVIILTLIILIVLLIFYLKHKEPFYFENNLIQKKEIPFAETFAMTAFEGDDEIKIYEFSATPIVGSPKQSVIQGPKMGFAHEEITRNQMDKAITTNNSIKYVDNTLMIPYLFQIIKGIVKQNTKIQQQLNQLAATIKIQ